jgi:hypothetical protein
MSDDPDPPEQSPTYGRFPAAAPADARRHVPRALLWLVAGGLGLVLVAGLGWGVVSWWRDGRLPAGHDAVAPGDLRVGDCIRLPESGETMTLVESVPCAEVHDAQVYAIVRLREADRTTTLGIEKRADAGCRARVAHARTLAPDGAKITTTYLMPSLHGSIGRLREVECLLEVLPGPTSAA